MFRFKALALSAFILLGAGAAHAQDPVTRLNQLGSYAGQIAPCKLIGFGIHEDDIDRFADTAAAEAVKGGFSESLAMTYLTNAMNQAAAEAKAETHGDQKDGPKFAAMILSRMQAWTANCHRIAQDPIGRILVTDNTTASDETLARTGADELLWTTGWASWQTPYIRAAGELSYGVAVCSNRLTRPQSEAYMAPIRAPGALPASLKDRMDRYLRFWSSQGEHDAEEFRFDATQCKRLLTARAAALKTAAH